MPHYQDKTLKQCHCGKNWGCYLENPIQKSVTDLVCEHCTDTYSCPTPIQKLSHISSNFCPECEEMMMENLRKCKHNIESENAFPQDSFLL